MYNAKSNMGIDPYSRLVSIPIHAEHIFHFPKGLPAFEHVKEFVFMHKPDLTPFVFMHALAPADLAFVCIDPFGIYPDYKPKISESDLEFLHIKSPSDLLLLSIVTVSPDVKNTTTNLQGPIAINIQASLGKQIICENQHYPIRYRIWNVTETVESQDNVRQRELVSA